MRRSHLGKGEGGCGSWPQGTLLGYVQPAGMTFKAGGSSRQGQRSSDDEQGRLLPHLQAHRWGGWGKEDSLEFDRAAGEAMALKSKTNK